MLPVYAHVSEGGYGITFKELLERLPQICQQHVEEGRATAFAFILYDSGDPEVAKVLHDAHYYRAIDAIAGSDLTVFSILRQTPEPERMVFYHIHSAMADPGKGSRSILARHFEMNEEPVYPSVLFFEVVKGAIAGTALVSIKSRTIEGTYAEIRELLTLAIDAIIEVEAPTEPGEILRAIQFKLDKRKFKLVGRKVYKVAIAIKELFDIFE